jgi:hypothetical protein
MIRNLITLQVLLTCFTLTSADLFADSPTTDQNPPFRSSCYVNKANQIRLAIDKNTVEAVSVVLRRDGEKLALATTYVPKKLSKLVYSFDVNELPDGLYTLELSNGQQITTHQVTINTSTPVQPSRQIALHR